MPVLLTHKPPLHCFVNETAIYLVRSEVLTAASVLLNYTYHFEFGLYLSELPPGKHLNMRAHLFPGSRFSCTQFDVSSNQLIATCGGKGKSVKLRAFIF